MLKYESAFNVAVLIDNVQHNMLVVCPEKVSLLDITFHLDDNMEAAVASLVGDVAEDQVVTVEILSITALKQTILCLDPNEDDDGSWEGNDEEIENDDDDAEEDAP